MTKPLYYTTLCKLKLRMLKLRGTSTDLLLVLEGQDLYGGGDQHVGPLVTDIQPPPLLLLLQNITK